MIPLCESTLSIERPSSSNGVNGNPGTFQCTGCFMLIEQTPVLMHSMYENGAPTTRLTTL